MVALACGGSVRRQGVLLGVGEMVRGEPIATMHCTVAAAGRANVQAQYGPLTGFLMRWPGGSLGSSGASAAGSAAAAGCSAGGASTTTSSWLMLQRHGAVKGER